MFQAFAGSDVRIVDFAATPVAILEHRGDPALVGQSVDRFIAWRKRAGLPPKVSATFNILYTDPDTTLDGEYRIGLCAGTSRPVVPNGYGVIAGLLPACRCATLRVIGSSHDLRPAFLFLHEDWLPRSGQRRGTEPLFLQRVTLRRDVPLDQTITDLFLPLA